jgi:hypothetical protein
VGPARVRRSLGAESGGPDRRALLKHRAFRSLATGEPVADRRLALLYPPYWHYDVLQALVVLGRLGKLGDPRVEDAVELMRERQRPDGLWAAEGHWWRRPGNRTLAELSTGAGRGPNEMIT